MIPRIILLLAAGALIAGVGQAAAHGGVDDGDGDPDAPPVIGGTPLEELYPGYYKFQDQFTTFGGNWARGQTPGTPSASVPVTTTAPIAP